MMFIAATALWQESDDFISRIWILLTRTFSFGRITVSISSVFLGTVVLVLTFALARYSSSFVEGRLKLRSHIDPGLRYTICRLIRYCIVTVGLLVAVKQAFAVDLTSIAVIFTALSVGIGFGLQFIAADIASGFILLFERPIRVGDRITIADDEGDVESINLRTTVVSTNDGIAIIIPNSKLVSQRVINWSYSDPRARIAIPVSVADDSDSALVTQSLLDAAKGVDNVLEEPTPRVQLMNFGSSSLDFRLLVWTKQPRRHTQIRSDINYRIYKIFGERKIRNPYPTQQMIFKGDSSGKQLEASLPKDEGPRMKD